MVRVAQRSRYRIDRNTTGGLAIEALERRDLLSGSPNVVKVEVASTSWSTAFVQKLNPGNPNAHGYAVPVGSTAQSATLTWDNINRISITFSEDVIIQNSDLSVTGVNTAVYHPSAFHYDPIAHVATWALSAPLNKDRVRIDLDGNGADPIRDLQGNILDGEWTNNSSVVSGNGTAGGDFEFNINILPTDINNSASITSYDYVYIRQLDGKTLTSVGYIANRDIDGNGVIDSVDWQKALDRALQVLPTGTAAGTYNDAPTTSGFASVQISNASVDTAISLLSGFSDNESGSSGLTYSILSNSNPALFDTAAVNASTQSLVLNAADSATGRAVITVRATDAGGLTVDSTIIVDVNRENQVPIIQNFAIGSLGNGLFLVTGDVYDDEDVSNFIVEFTNVFTLRSAVNQAGHFEFAVELPNGASGVEYAITRDSQGVISETYWHDIYMT